MSIAVAEGKHPAIIARDFTSSSGRPAKKAEAMMRNSAAGGSVKWHALDDTIADATFSHPQGGSVRITWDMARAKQAGLIGRGMSGKYPRAMLRSRCVSPRACGPLPARDLRRLHARGSARHGRRDAGQRPDRRHARAGVLDDEQIGAHLAAIGCGADDLATLKRAYAHRLQRSQAGSATWGALEQFEAAKDTRKSNEEELP